MLHFEKRTLINAPVEVVWEFHLLGAHSLAPGAGAGVAPQHPDVWTKLTPPWQPVKILNRQGGLEIGATTEFLLNFGLVQIHWLAEHIESEKPHLFTDIQKQGPMEYWRHRHQFTSVEDKTLLIDAIDYVIPGGLLAELLLKDWVNSRLEDMFTYRHQVTKQQCES